MHSVSAGRLPSVITFSTWLWDMNTEDTGSLQALWAPQIVWMIPGSLTPTHPRITYICYPGVTNDAVARGLPENPGPGSAAHSYLIYPQNRGCLGHPHHSLRVGRGCRTWMRPREPKSVSGSSPGALQSVPPTCCSPESHVPNARLCPFSPLRAHRGIKDNQPRASKLLQSLVPPASCPASLHRAKGLSSLSLGVSQS